MELLPERQRDLPRHRRLLRPVQLNNIIKERPEKAKELFDKLRLFMGELKTM